MYPATPIDEESGLPGQRKNHMGQGIYTDHTLVSLPDKDELLLLLQLNRTHNTGKNCRSGR
jgi:hypothetical protein